MLNPTPKAKRSFNHEDLEDYDSNFGDEGEDEEKIANKRDLTQKSQPKPFNSDAPGIPSKTFFQDQQRRAEGYMDRYRSLNAHERHMKLINEYRLYYPGSADKLFKRDSSKDKNDDDIIRENHKFIWDEAEANTWGKQLAKKYYDKLFKEYGLYDLSKFKEGKIAVRWRVEKEVVDGRGHFTCGEKACTNETELKSWEINFAYMEESVKKNALVKIRACPSCSDKLIQCKNVREVPKKQCSKKRKHHHSKHKKNTSKKSKSSTSETNISDVSGQSTSSLIPEESSEGIWKDPIVIPELKSREEEFDSYLEDMFP